MTDFFRIEIGKAAHGDSILAEWSDGGRTRRMLIDGGPRSEYETLVARLGQVPERERAFELIVLSHVDTDHIDGMVRLFAEAPENWPVTTKEVWFNGWDHLDSGTLGGRQGEFFSALLDHRLDPRQWNGSFDGHAVVVPDDGPLPTVKLGGGMKLTLLSPTPAKLAKMRDAWRRDLKGSGIKPGDLEAALEILRGTKQYVPRDSDLLGSTRAGIDSILERQFNPDNAAANGASIAFLAEHPAGSCLFLADAHADAVGSSIARLLAERKLDRLRVDAVKVAHHGSKNNTDEALVALIDSPRYLFSTNGAIFKHPDEEAIARIIAGSPRPVTLHFNYLTEFNRKWQGPALQAKHGFSARYADEGPIVIELGK